MKQHKKSAAVNIPGFFSTVFRVGRLPGGFCRHAGGRADHGGAGVRHLEDQGTAWILRLRLNQKHIRNSGLRCLRQLAGKLVGLNIFPFQK